MSVCLVLAVEPVSDSRKGIASALSPIPGYPPRYTHTSAVYPPIYTHHCVLYVPHIYTHLPLCMQQNPDFYMHLLYNLWGVNVEQ